MTFGVSQIAVQVDAADKKVADIEPDINIFDASTVKPQQATPPKVQTEPEVDLKLEGGQRNDTSDEKPAINLMFKTC